MARSWSPPAPTGAVEVSVPATSANLGPGYDSLGLALRLRDTVRVRVLPGSARTVAVEGAGAGEVPLDERHLVARAMARAFEWMAAPLPGFAMHCENVIPHGRGLGSSSAAIVAGICAARALVAGGHALLDDESALTLATEIEGHPDNVAAALRGGFTICYREGARTAATVMAVDRRIATVVFVPPFRLETTVARGLLPDSVPHADAAANSARAALLVAAVSGHPELLLPATEDRLHQEYRRTAMPQTCRLVEDLRRDGVPAVVSGAGPTVLAFAGASTRDGVAARAPSGWEARCLQVDHDGARATVVG